MSQTESESRRIYLDNAATTWPKSDATLRAVSDFIRDCGATSGRGAYANAQIADRWLLRARAHLAKLLSVHNAADIAICNSGTHALNSALFGLIKPGDHVITTSMEHNSVLRPLAQMQRRSAIEFDIVPSDLQGRAKLDAAADLFRDTTKMLVVGHASNVTGAANDLQQWSRLAQRHEVLFVVDASQTLGYLPIDVLQLGLDALASAGHKGLGGLQGTGLVYLADRLQAEFRPLMFGGTGVASEQVDEFPSWPQSVEVGNLNMPGVVSLAVAAQEAYDRQEESQSGWLPAFQRLVEGLQQLAKVKIIGDYDFERQPLDFVPVVSLQIEGWSAHDLAAILDTSFQIETRAGWHCAALIHRDIGSMKDQGTLRLSTGHGTTIQQVEATLDAFQAIHN